MAIRKEILKYSRALFHPTTVGLNLECIAKSIIKVQATYSFHPKAQGEVFDRAAIAAREWRSVVALLAVIKEMGL
jgi:hypothetical protein